MAKKKTQKRGKKIHKKGFRLIWIVGLILVGILILVLSKDKFASRVTIPGYQSVGEEGYVGDKAPATEEYKEAIIRIKDGKFEPERLEVSPDTLIIFENEDKVPHAVVSDKTGKPDEISFDTGELPYQENVPTVEYGFPGTYTYYDKLNPQIRGSIVVKE